MNHIAVTLYFLIVRSARGFLDQFFTGLLYSAVYVFHVSLVALGCIDPTQLLQLQILASRLEILLSCSETQIFCLSVKGVPAGFLMH